MTGFEIFNAAHPEIACAIPEGLCLLGYRGSIAHNMFVPSSDPNSIDDVDLMGVVLAPEDCYLGLHEWGSRGTKEVKQGQYDCVWYELRKMFSLLLHGNPNVLSLLWVRPEHYLYLNDFGRELVANRGLFRGRHVYNAFAGYASAQLEKMETREPAELREYMAVTAEMKYRGVHPNHKGEHFAVPARESGIAKDVQEWGVEKLLTRLRCYQKKGENIGYLGEKRKQLVLEHGFDAKNSAHCIRLLRMCKEFLDTGNMQVYREADAAELLEIKRGRWSLNRIKEHAADLFAEIRIARDASPLPSEPDREKAGALLSSILRRHLSLDRAPISRGVNV